MVKEAGKWLKDQFQDAAFVGERESGRRDRGLENLIYRRQDDCKFPRRDTVGKRGSDDVVVEKGEGRRLLEPGGRGEETEEEGGGLTTTWKGDCKQLSGLKRKGTSLYFHGLMPHEDSKWADFPLVQEGGRGCSCR